MPTDALAIAPIILAVVLVVSAVGKIRAPRASAEAFRDLRVPAPLASHVVVQGLPWGEFALAVLLVAASGRLGVTAAVAALLLFVAYLALVVRALGFEESVDCACFGEFAPGRITKRTVWRNVWLVVLAVGALALSFQGGSPLAQLLGDRVALAWFLAAIAAALTTYLITVRAPEPSQPQGETLVSTEDFDDYVRTITPALPVTFGDGTETDLRALSAQRAQLLLFVSETCGSCSDVIAAAPAWREELPQVDVRIVVSAEPSASAITSEEEPLSLHDPAHRLPSSFGFHGTPSALLLGADGMLAGGPVTGSTAVPDFVAEIREELRAVTAEF